jgi:hypothetical protein
VNLPSEWSRMERTIEEARKRSPEAAVRRARLMVGDGTLSGDQTIEVLALLAVAYCGGDPVDLDCCPVCGAPTSGSHLPVCPWSRT